MRVNAAVGTWAWRVNSEEFAERIARVGNECSRIVVAIGGPYGHDDAMRQRADWLLRLSDMVLNHKVARVVVLEQIYRAWTIIRGEPYHHR